MRVLEQEAMMSEEEVLAYDLLVKKYLSILHNGFVETVLNLSPQRGKFLDVGTGSGWIAIGVAKNNPDAEVVGIDLSETMLHVAEKNARQEGVSARIRFMQGDAKNLPFAPESFDAVFSHNMMHHLPEPIDMVRDMQRVAKADGALAVRDLKRHSPLMTSLHVNIFGLPYTPLMKKEYRDSILAALSEEEWRQMHRSLGIQGSKLTKQSVTHMTIEKASSNRRKIPASVPTPTFLRPFKALYVTR